MPFHVDNFTGVPVVLKGSVFLSKKMIPYLAVLHLNYAVTAAACNNVVLEHGGLLPLILRLAVGHGPEKVVLTSLPDALKVTFPSALIKSPQ
jgi:hypothetical protein